MHGAVRCSANSRSKCNTRVEKEREERRSRFGGNYGRRMAVKYRQLNAEERSVLAALRTLGLSQAEIAGQMGRHRSSDWPELRRNCAPYDGCYRCVRAHQR